jgi:hypothetical protein
MTKVFMLMTALFSLVSTGHLWADDLNPQPLPPGVTERKAGGENLTLHDQSQISGNLNGTGKSKGLHKSAYFIKYNKATNSYDKWQKINGKTSPYTGGSKTGDAYFKAISRNGGAGAGKLTIGSATSGAGGGKSSISGNGFDKTAAVDSFDKTNGFQKANGLDKSGLNGGTLPAVQK